MSSKRRQSIKREGRRNFCPNEPPTFYYGGKVLKSLYDRSCYIEGHGVGQHEYEQQLKDETAAIDRDRCDLQKKWTEAV
jgi:hypothetical protein